MNQKTNSQYIILNVEELIAKQHTKLKVPERSKNEKETD